MRFNPHTLYFYVRNCPKAKYIQKRNVNPHINITHTKEKRQSAHQHREPQSFVIKHEKIRMKKLTEWRVAEGANAEAQPQRAIGISDLDSMVSIVVTMRESKDSIRFMARGMPVLIPLHFACLQSSMTARRGQLFIQQVESSESSSRASRGLAFTRTSRTKHQRMTQRNRKSICLRTRNK